MIVAPSTPAPDQKQIVYLLGAGATHGAALLHGNTYGLLMKDLRTPIVKELGAMLNEEQYRSDVILTELVNLVASDESDIEQLITFLDDSVSSVHRTFARALREVFASVLRKRLGDVAGRIGTDYPKLYSVLIDMHSVSTLNEQLRGFITLNYDVFLEAAIRQLNREIDLGIDTMSVGDESPILVLKLHGSFGWSDHWPVDLLDPTDSLWIPPGIRKSKNDYPFNLIWGMARELLDCDVLRIIGCNLSSNDWDLVSLLFTSRYLRHGGHPFDIEFIADRSTSERVRSQLSYLEIKSIEELDEVGPLLVHEMISGGPRSVSMLDADELTRLHKKLESELHNPFAQWLKLKGEVLAAETADLETPTNIFSDFVFSTRV